MTMSKGAPMNAIINTSDVIEFETPEGTHTAIVLLANDDALIVDLLDGSTPISLMVSELDGVRVFDPQVLELAA